MAAVNLREEVKAALMVAVPVLVAVIGMALSLR